MFASVSDTTLLVLRHCRLLLPRVTVFDTVTVTVTFPSSPLFSSSSSSYFPPKMNNSTNPNASSFSSYAHSSSSGGRGSSFDMRNDRERTRGCGSGHGGGGSSGKDKLTLLVGSSTAHEKIVCMTRILRHMASELNLGMRSDGYVKVNDLLKLNMKTFANVPLRSHNIDDVREAVRKDNKQHFSLIEENGELLIRANQGHTITAVETESLLKPILSAEEVSGMRQDVNVLIFLDVRKALEEGMKLFISDNKVILTEGFDGVIPPKYFQKIESWPGRQPIPFQNN
ncbi:hypothetical protein PIB30_066792 [Stylosanthes scabra]|uniref:2'-phosphotransferase n=1 Tax=Stylosanthes scabra TaxID=79078 RepID=A0ABU6YLC6_9FABA|nr:hypothetical protein [Stylosanthes scabra]